MTAPAEPGPRDGEPSGAGGSGAAPVSLEQLAGAVEQLLDLHTVLREQVEELIEEPTRSRGPKVFRWAVLDATAAEAAWVGLSGWVDWLMDRHAVREVPRGCWWRHGSVVEELTALWWAWQAAYDAKADPQAPLIWLEQLDRARDRVRTKLTQQGACAPGEHHAATVARTTEAEQRDFGRFVQADVSRRSPAVLSN